MLVQYNRPDVKGPKLSEFNILETDDPKMLHKILEQSVGVLGEVKKQRWLFMHEQTRIHLDKVDNLGTFLEFEVCLRPEQTVDDGKIIADKLMEVFLIRPDDLMAGAYLDELLPKLMWIACIQPNKTEKKLFVSIRIKIVVFYVQSFAAHTMN